MSKLRILTVTIFVLLVGTTFCKAMPAHITSFADIVEPLIPTVVNIYTVKHGEDNENTKSFPEIFQLDKFNNFLEQFNIPFSFDEVNNSPNIFALGSGFIVDTQGYIITNDHVVSGSDEIFVKLYDNTEIPAKIVGTDPKTDLALLKIDAKENLPFVNFGDSSELRVGDVVIAIGNSLGFGGTVTTGIISSKGRDLGEDQDELVDDFIQTDAAINTGNSGGPLFNIEGQVIGLNTALPEVSGGTNIGIGFAIPSNTVKAIMSQLKEKGKISRGKLDISVQQVTPELAEALSLDKSYGVLVVNTKPGGIGEIAGLKRGDLITEFNEKQILNSRKLQLLVGECKIGDKVELTVLRDNNIVKLEVNIVELENNVEEEKELNVENSLEKSGVILADLSTSIREKFNIKNTEKGIIVVDINAKETNFDLQIGDLVTTIDQQTIENIEQFDNIFEKIKATGKKSIVLLVKRRDFTMFVAFPIT